MKSLLSFLALSPLVLIACGKSKGNSDEKSPTGREGGNPQSGGVTLTTEYVSAGTLTLATQLRDAFQSTLAGLSGANLTAFSGGQTSLESLVSLKYRVSSVSLCSKLVTQGTATSCQGSSLELYRGVENGTGADDYNTFLPDQAAASDLGYIDFKDGDALKALSKTVQITSPGSYDSALVYFFRPFKITASVTLANGTTIHTKSGGTSRCVGENLNTTCETRVTDMATAPAGESVFFLSNGGTYVRLQKPFAITQEDLDNQVKFKAVFAIDLDGLVKGGTQDFSTTGQTWISGVVEDTKFKISAPFIQMAPVVARESETITREAYLLTPRGTPSNPHKVRLSLYSVKEDPDRSIRAAVSQALMESTSTSILESAFAAVDHIGSNSDGTVDLFDWQGAKLVRGLKRNFTKGESCGSIVNEICSNNQPGQECGTKTEKVYDCVVEDVIDVDAPTAN